MLQYLLMVSLGVSAFWLLYHLAFKHQSKPRTNRSFLLLGLTAPFFVPFVTLPSGAALAAEPVLLPLTEIGGNWYPHESTTTLNWGLWLYLTGILIWAGYYASGLVHLLKIKKQATLLQTQPKVYGIPGKGMPFSFAGKILIPQSLNGKQRKTVLEHKWWHLRCYHSADILLAMAVHSVLWFLPILPFYLRDLKQNMNTRWMLKCSKKTHLWLMPKRSYS